jgi:8-oxo-dGTP pyrophosphatase MutT (NUDIX family)
LHGSGWRTALILSTRSRDKDVYYLPGGKRELGETDVQTLVREIREELFDHLHGDGQLV